MVLFIIIAVFAFPFLIWLFANYTKYSEGNEHPKRKIIAIGFLSFLSLFGFMDSLFLKLSDQVGLIVLVAIIFIFSTYMLFVIRKDKKENPTI
ncbi:hypothetical protein SM124_15385 [Bacillus sp. 31A1R]|uniref:Uncharacterized protein n=1 Tax=Robertmurraya mangrovi TaxID=3098077 RepID=A0ABU5J161_9BACI|nr:hypothetical protein [Bacillus sp. 31A1R]MDZ5473101.1 hypothetical protein [Bacillus sp. 31A1R]